PGTLPVPGPGARGMARRRRRAVRPQRRQRGRSGCVPRSHAPVHRHRPCRRSRAAGDRCARRGWRRRRGARDRPRGALGRARPAATVRGMSTMQTLVAFLAALTLLIFVRELGHYLVARWCDVKVLRFSIGFGKPLFTWRVGPDRTEWTLAAVPLGGYVRMLDERDAGPAQI